jgi:AraC-like DNA-binding protein
MKMIPPVFIRYLFLFLLFALILLLLFVPIYWYITSFTMKSELGYMAEKLNAGIRVIDTTIAVLNNAAISTRQDSRFRTLGRSLSKRQESEEPKPEINPYTFMELKDVFNTLLESNTLVADAGIVFPGNVYLTRYRIFSYPPLARYYGEYFQCGDLSKDEWMALLSKERPLAHSRSYKSTDHGEYEAIMFSIRWDWALYPEEIILFAALPVKNIISLITDSDIAALGYINIYDSQGNLLFNQENGLSGNFHVVSATSAGYSIKYEIGIPDFLIWEKMRPVKNLIFIFATVTAIVTLFLSLLFAWQSTKPLQAFIDSIATTRIIREKYERLSEKLSLNPFKSFRQIFYDIAEDFSRADKKMENSLHIIERETQLIRIRMLDKIREGLESGNDAAACVILQESAATLPEREDPSISILLADMFSGMIKELRNRYPELLGGIEVPAYTYGTQSVFFRQVLPDCFVDIGGRIRKHREKVISKSEQEILDFINGHICDPELYVNMVSDHFHISAPSIQKLVKKASGQTFLAYVENRRLRRAYEILARGEHSIRETAELCGFSYASSFNRAFKRVYGFSPGRILNSGEK